MAYRRHIVVHCACQIFENHAIRYRPPLVRHGKIPCEHVSDLRPFGVRSRRSVGIEEEEDVGAGPAWTFERDFRCIFRGYMRYICGSRDVANESK